MAVVDSALIKVLESRRGQMTVAVFSDGAEIEFANFSWGYDLGEAYAYVSTEPVATQAVGVLFSTRELIGLLNHETRSPLFSFPI